MTRSIRTRIVVWFVALTASLLALFAGILALWLHEARRAALDAALRERAHALLGQMDVEYGGLEIDREGGAPLPSEGEGRWFAVLTFPTLWRVGESRPAGPLSAERVGAIAAALGSGSSELYLTLPGARAGTRVYAALLPVPPDVLPRIFDRFYRADESRSRSAGGSGLGLALVRTIAEAAGGSVSVRSVAGEGTTVTVDLPRARRGGREAGS